MPNEEEIQRICKEQCAKFFSDECRKKYDGMIEKEIDSDCSCCVYLVILIILLSAFGIIFFTKGIYAQIKEKSDLLICIICASILISVSIVCFTVALIKIYKNKIQKKKLCSMNCEIESMKNSLIENEQKIKDIKCIKCTTEYYPKNKAVIDLFKAYANAMAEL